MQQFDSRMLFDDVVCVTVNATCAEAEVIFYSVNYDANQVEFHHIMQVADSKNS